MGKRAWLRYALLLGLLIGVPALAFVGVEAYNSLNRSLPVINPNPKEEQTHRIPAFAFVNQNGDTVRQADFKGKVYVANFFFTACPSTCPPMMENLTRVQKRFQDTGQLAILSHTVDPKHDTVEALHAYAQEYGVREDQWDLVTGSKASLYTMARNAYDVASLEGGDGLAGFVHSSKLILVDRQQRIRGYYDGTEKQAVNELMKDIAFLLKQPQQAQS